MHIKEAIRILLSGDISLDKIASVEPVSIDKYMTEGGYHALTKAVKEMQPMELIKEVEASGLQGRGGGGFPAWRKWESVHNAPSDVKSAKKGPFGSSRSQRGKSQRGEKYVVCNAAEGEPGTLKDRYLIRSNPHQLIEGVILASYAVGAHVAIIYVRSSEEEIESKILEKALIEAEEKGFLGNAVMGSSFNLEIKLFKAPDSYVAGEETAMLEAIEGKAARPRIKPPYPTLQGIYGKPTLINNVETLSNIPHIINHGGNWFSIIGTEDSPGTKLFTLTGDIEKPGIYELPMGILLRDLIFGYGGGIKDGKGFKAAFPGGPSTPLMTDLDIPMDFKSLEKKGSALGTGGVIVFSEDRCMVRVAVEFSRFFKEGSCGLCPPCVTGSSQLTEILDKIERGNGEMADMMSIEEVSDFMRGRGYCQLVSGASLSAASVFRAFEEEFIEHISSKQCPIKAD